MDALTNVGVPPMPTMDNRNILIMLREARAAAKQRMQPCLRTHGLTEQQWRVMKVLGETSQAGQQGAESGEIARLARLLPSTLTGILGRLERDGRVTRKRSKVDARFKLVTPTEEGLALIDVVSRELHERYQQIEADLGKENLHALYGLLDKVIDLEPRETLEDLMLEDAD